jgi:Zn-dependent M16 (insulinase) family peptidase
MSRYIIGTIANLDHLMTLSEKGDLAFRRYMEKTTRESIQEDRDAVLATTPEDIQKMSKVLASILGQQVYCVYGNEDKLKANRNLFKSLVTLQKSLHGIKKEFYQECCRWRGRTVTWHPGIRICI